jgi:hypothetical protein
VSVPGQDWRMVEAALAGVAPDRCRRIAVAAAARALAGWPGHPATLDAVLDQALRGEADPGLLTEAQGIAEGLDARYLDLYDDEEPNGRTPGWEDAFRQARAAAAVVSAIGDDARRAASGAVYEASHALGEDLIQLTVETA